MFNPSTITAEHIYNCIQRAGIDQQYVIDHTAQNMLLERILDAGSRRQLITYSELVHGLSFTAPVMGMRTFFIDVHNWEGIYRKVIGSTLAQIMVETILHTKCILTTIVVDKTENAPSRVLFDWLGDIGVLPDNHELTELAFWAHHVKLVHEYCKRPDMKRLLPPTPFPLM